MTRRALPPVSERTILSLCDYTGNWSRPYKEAGYPVVQVDLKLGEDARLFKKLDRYVHGILAAPVCTAFSAAGARHWAAKEAEGNTQLLEGLALVDACLRIVLVHKPLFWVLENPVGRLKDWIGFHRHTFNPSEYAGYLGDHVVDDSKVVKVACDAGPYKKGTLIQNFAWVENAYTKRTCLWGDFNIPMTIERPAIHGSMMWAKYGGKSERTKEKRSATPLGFAIAFQKHNP